MIRRDCVSFPVLAGLLLGLWIGSGMEPAHAQLGEPMDALHRHAGPDVGVRMTLRGHTVPSEQGPTKRERDDSPRIGRALFGSTVGVGAGVGVGLLLLKAVDEASPEENTRWHDEEASDAAATMTLIGVAAMAAGGPIGAVKGAGIERGRRDAYVGAGVGELVGGLLGLALAGQLHDSTPSRLIGLGAGMAAGSATGALWVAAAQKETDNGLFSYEKGRWEMSVPDVQVRPRLTTPRSPSVGVTVLSAQF
jgi:hypothetical protein